MTEREQTFEPMLYAAALAGISAFLMVYWRVGNTVSFWPAVAAMAGSVFYLISGIRMRRKVR